MHYNLRERERFVIFIYKNFLIIAARSRILGRSLGLRPFYITKVVPMCGSIFIYMYVYFNNKQRASHVFFLYVYSALAIVLSGTVR